MGQYLTAHTQQQQQQQQQQMIKTLVGSFLPIKSVGAGHHAQSYQRVRLEILCMFQLRQLVCIFLVEVKKLFQ